jgi:catechol 2,3-dioxygenase
LEPRVKIDALGHVVLRVRDLARAEAFYHELLGIPISARAPQWSMIFLTLGEHHDFAVSAIGAEAVPASEKALGLDHVAFRVAGGLDALQAAKTRLEVAGISVAAVDHTVTRSLYFRDPDGNLVEIYVNGTDAWRRDPTLILSEAGALDLSASGAAPDAESATRDLEIGLAGSDDLESIRLLVVAFRDHLQAGVPSDADLKAHLPQALCDPSIEFACARLGGQAVGYTQTRYFRSVWVSGLEALLEDLFVRPEVRGRAVGRALLRHALERARERGARLVGLTTNERNRTAQGLYRSEGFRPQSARIWPDGREIRWVVRLDGTSG